MNPKSKIIQTQLCCRRRWQIVSETRKPPIPCHPRKAIDTTTSSWGGQRFFFDACGVLPSLGCWYFTWQKWTSICFVQRSKIQLPDQGRLPNARQDDVKDIVSTPLLCRLIASRTPPSSFCSLSSWNPQCCFMRNALACCSPICIMLLFGTNQLRGNKRVTNCMAESQPFCIFGRNWRNSQHVAMHPVPKIYVLVKLDSICNSFSIFTTQKLTWNPRIGRFGSMFCLFPEPFYESELIPKMAIFERRSPFPRPIMFWLSMFARNDPSSMVALLALVRAQIPSSLPNSEADDQAPRVHQQHLDVYHLKH